MAQRTANSVGYQRVYTVTTNGLHLTGEQYAELAIGLRKIGVGATVEQTSRREHVVITPACGELVSTVAFAQGHPHEATLVGFRK